MGFCILNMPNGNKKMFSNPHIQFQYVCDDPWGLEVPKFTRKLFGLQTNFTTFCNYPETPMSHLCADTESQVQQMVQKLALVFLAHKKFHPTI